MTFNYAKTAATAARLLARFGGPVTLTRIAPGTYDPTTGTTAADTTTTSTGSGARFGYEQREIDGTKIRTGDQRAYLSTAVFQPRTDDRVAFSDGTFLVVTARVLKPGAVAVLYEMQLRGVA